MGEKQGETGTIARAPPPPPLSLSCLPSSPPPPHLPRSMSISPSLFHLNAWNRLWIVMLRILQLMNKTCLVTSQVVAGSREWFCFLQENLFMLCISMAQGKLILYSKCCNTRVWCDSRSILSSQMSVFTQLATTWFFFLLLNNFGRFRVIPASFPWRVFPVSLPQSFSIESSRQNNSRSKTCSESPGSKPKTSFWQDLISGLQKVYSCICL